jgi:hypothetical protein
VAGLAWCCILLGSVIAPVAVVIAAVFNRGFSSRSILVALIGCLICWTAASIALVTTFLGSRFNAPVQALFVGMLFRMGLPFAALIGFSAIDQTLTDNGLAITILGTYLVALLVETLLAVRIAPITSTAKAA